MSLIVKKSLVPNKAPKGVGLISVSGAFLEDYGSVLETKIIANEDRNFQFLKIYFKLF